MALVSLMFMLNFIEESERHEKCTNNLEIKSRDYDVMKVCVCVWLRFAFAFVSFCGRLIHYYWVIELFQLNAINRRKRVDRNQQNIL